MNNLLRLSDVNIDDVIRYLRPSDLKILLYLEDYSNETDIMLENMEYYFVDEELFEFAAVIRDEIKRRKNGTVI